ncbi:hypothetical protein PCCS19_54360 [Paenibacillus sp. CCS19]|uniref:hypothetical protein n=1 Tax=Paenibacillus sp. CCS19 TaxID=3158387 RepID=UPI00255D6F47|nr:hypothetical protein [Paenibacillus cellulosilyticus]GMK42377.1 hypothetical protein PCCS19_54360 [Paenibacillus cellulosilyticus]
MTDSMSKLALMISAISGFAYLIVYVRTRKRVGSYIAQESQYYNNSSSESEEELQASQSEYRSLFLTSQYVMILLAMAAIIFGVIGVFGHSTE